MPLFRVVLPAALALVLLAPASAWGAQRFPRGFLWGTATSGFQVEAGGTPSHADRRSDWWAFSHDPDLIGAGLVSGDRVERGAGQWRVWRRDLALADRQLHNNAIRMGIEWSRIFPRSTEGVELGPGGRITRSQLRRLDGLADGRAVRYYRRVLRAAQARGLRTMLTLHHYTLPLWLHDPAGVRRAFEGRDADAPLPAGLRRAGWIDRSTVGEFRKFAAYVAWKLGASVDLWATLNEPLVQVSQGLASIPGVTGFKAPGILSFTAAAAAVQNLALGNAAAYDAIHALRPRSRVGFVHNMADWRPMDPASAADRRGTRHAEYVLSRLFLNAVVRGVYDGNANGQVDPGERRRRLASRADFIGVNYYSPAYVTGLPTPVSTRVPLFDFTPTVAYRGTGNPAGPPCPRTCTDFGWLIDPRGLRNVLRLAASYELPIYITENGIDDADDDLRPGYLVGHLRAVRGAISDGADVRGYFHWSLVDNFEWAEGYRAHFGLYSFDPDTLARRPRSSARLYGRIAAQNALPDR
jgi:beta-galactosidase